MSCPGDRDKEKTSTTDDFDTLKERFDFLNSLRLKYEEIIFIQNAEIKNLRAEVKTLRKTCISSKTKLLLQEKNKDDKAVNDNVGSGYIR